MKCFFLFKDGTLVALAELDRETQDSYDLVIIATDHGKPQRQVGTERNGNAVLRGISKAV